MTNKIAISQVDDLVILLDDGTSPLIAAGSLVGNVFLVSGYTHITGYIYSDVTSAAGGVIIEQGLKIGDFTPGTPATTGVTSTALAYTGGDIINNAYSVQIVAPYARIIYINGASPQTDFRAYFEARVMRGL
jgi:hypothetical protein